MGKELEERGLRDSDQKYSGWNVGSNKGKGRSTNNEIIRGRIKKGKQLQIHGGRGGEERRPV